MQSKGTKAGYEEAYPTRILSPVQAMRQGSGKSRPRFAGKQGITFQRLLDEARRELARHYLLHSSRELNETAYLLGYEDANSFFRAFHNWEVLRLGNGGCSKRTRSLRHKRKLVKREPIAIMLAKEINTDKTRVFTGAVHSDELSPFR